MAILEDEMRAGARTEQLSASATSSEPSAGQALPLSDGGSGATDIRYPPGIKLFGEEKRRRDREIAEAVQQHVDPATGRLPAAIAQQVYRDVGRRFGLSASGVILRTPAEAKPTNQETLEYARSQKGKRPPGERAQRGRRRRAVRAVEPPEGERKRRRDATVQQRVREAAMEFVDPATGRIPAARATEVYQLLADRFERTPGTVSNYLKGLTPTARECADLRWSRHRERLAAEGGTAPTSRGKSQEEIDYSSHPAALFPVAEPQPTPRRRKGEDPIPLKERVKTMIGPDGRLIDYDESYQVQRMGETVETKLDEATSEFLRSFRVQQAAEFIDALKDCGRSMNHYVLHTQKFLQEFQQSLRAVGDRIQEVAGESLQEIKQRHNREIRELKEYIAALEEDNMRLNSQLNRVRSILGAAEGGSQTPDRTGTGTPAPRPAPSRSVRGD